MSGRNSEQVEFMGEAERNARTERYFESGVVDPGNQNAAICSFHAEQITGPFELLIPRCRVLSLEDDS